MGAAAIFTESRTKVATLHKKKGESGFRVYDIPSKQLLFESESYNICESMEFSPDEKLITPAAEKLDGKHCVAIYDVASGKKIKELATKTN